MLTSQCSMIRYTNALSPSPIKTSQTHWNASSFKSLNIHVFSIPLPSLFHCVDNEWTCNAGSEMILTSLKWQMWAELHRHQQLESDWVVSLSIKVLSYLHWLRTLPLVPQGLAEITRGHHMGLCSNFKDEWDL